MTDTGDPADNYQQVEVEQEALGYYRQSEREMSSREAIESSPTYVAMTTNWLTALHDAGDPDWRVPAYTGRSREARFVNRLVTIGSRREAGRVARPRYFMPLWASKIYRETLKRAATKGHTCALSEADMLWMVWRSRGLCEVSGLPFDMARRGAGEWRPFVPSVDRKSSQVGYSLENARLVVLIANVAMNGWGEEPLNRLARALVEKAGTAPGLDR